MLAFFYYLAMILPARWFIDSSRKLFLQGKGIEQIAPNTP